MHLLQKILGLALVFAGLAAGRYRVGTFVFLPVPDYGLIVAAWFLTVAGSLLLFGVRSRVIMRTWFSLFGLSVGAPLIVGAGYVAIGLGASSYGPFLIGIGAVMLVPAALCLAGVVLVWRLTRDEDAWPTGSGWARAGAALALPAAILFGQGRILDQRHRALIYSDTSIADTAFLDEETLVVDAHSGPDQRTLTKWDVARGVVLQRQSYEQRENSQPRWMWAFAKSGTLLTRSNDELLSLFSSRDLTKIWTRSAGESDSVCVDNAVKEQRCRLSFKPLTDGYEVFRSTKGQLVGRWGSNGKILISKASSPDTTWRTVESPGVRLTAGQRTYVATGVALSDAGLLALCHDRRLVVVNASEPSSIWQMDLAFAECKQVAFSPEQRKIAAWGNNAIAVVDSSARTARYLRLPESYVPLTRRPRR